MNIVRMKDIPWEDRKNVDNWLSKAGLYYANDETELVIRLIDYPFGSTEPRHTHPGTHATTVLKNTAIVDGLTLGPLDVVIGPSNEPHGPLHYSLGCNLISAFQGSFFHSEVEELSTEKHYRLIRQVEIPWADGPDGSKTKMLVDHGAGRLHVEAMRFPAGATHRPAFLAALVQDGAITIDGEKLGVWDFIYAEPGDARSEVSFDTDTTLLTYTLRDQG